MVKHVFFSARATLDPVVGCNPMVRDGVSEWFAGIFGDGDGRIEVAPIFVPEARRGWRAGGKRKLGEKRVRTNATPGGLAQQKGRFQ